MKNLFSIILILIPIALFGQNTYDIARQVMVKTQLLEKGITDSAVIRSMSKIERHRFVPKDYVSSAYDDRALPIGQGQSISKPSLVALMTQSLNLKPQHKVLEIGTGSGYQAAVLAEICDSVYSVEIMERLGKQAKRNLQKLNYTNVNIKIGDGYQGWKQHAPYDRIIVTCTPSRIPGALINQLAEGGVLVIPLGTPSFQRLLWFEKKNGELIERTIANVNLDAMISKKRRKYVVH